jgi:dTDP-4-dehydrorhamnose 3,5-epimerase-like enzyme
VSRLIRLRCIEDPTGCLTPLDAADLPFPLQRVWFLHDVPEGARRGGHAHHEMEELVVAVSGSFDVVTVGALGRHRWHLNRASVGLYIPPGEWRYLANFSSNAVALVAASTTYDPEDYIRDLDRFMASLPAIGEDYFTRRSKAAREGKALWETER